MSTPTAPLEDRLARYQATLDAAIRQRGGAVSFEEGAAGLSLTDDQADQRSGGPRRQVIVTGLDGRAVALVPTAPEDRSIASVTNLATRRERRWLLTAAAIVLVAVGGLALAQRRGTDAPAGSSSAQPVSSAALTFETLPVVSVSALPELDTVSPTGQLLSAALTADAVPLVVPGGSGWELTNAFATNGPTLTGGFEGATVIVGDGPTFDSPLFAATVVDASSEPGGTPVSVPIIETLLSQGEPVQVAGTTGAVTVTETDGDTGLAGPIVTMFWPLEANQYARVNAVRLTVDEVVVLADQLTLVEGRLTMNVPSDYRALAVPAPGDRRNIEYKFASGGRTLELNGENRGVASLLGRLAGEVRTTRVIDEVEVAYRPLPEAPGEYWADWQTGDWSFYVIASGFASEEEFLSALASLTLTDSATFEAAGSAIAVVMPGVHNELAGRALGAVGLSDAAFADAATTALPMSADSYGFELIQGAACVWFTRWAESGDTSAQQTIAVEIEQTIEASKGTDFERAADLILVPLLDTVSGRQPETVSNYSNDCPGWSAAG